MWDTSDHETGHDAILDGVAAILAALAPVGRWLRGELQGFQRSIGQRFSGGGSSGLLLSLADTARTSFDRGWIRDP